MKARAILVLIIFMFFAGFLSCKGDSGNKFYELLLLKGGALSAKVKTLWARSVTTGVEQSQFLSIAAGNNSIYAAGSIYGSFDTYDFGNSKTIRINNDHFNVLIVKYDTNGTPQFVKSVTSGPRSSGFQGLSVGIDGVYAVGYIAGSSVAYDFGNDKTVTINNSYNNAVLVKYNEDCEAQWITTLQSGPNHSRFTSVAVSNDGIYAAGYLYGSSSAYDFGNGKTVTINNDAATQNIILVKYDLNGVAQWSTSVVSGPSHTTFNSVALGSDGIYASGFISGNTTEYDFNNYKKITVNNAFLLNSLLVKYDTNGAAQWIRSITGGSGTSEYYATSFGAGFIYAAGYIAGGSVEYDFGNGKTITEDNTNSQNIVLAKYDVDGNAQWIKSINGSNDRSYYRSITIDSGGIYAAGYLASGKTIGDFGNDITLNLPGDHWHTVLLVKYNHDGEAQWVKALEYSLASSVFTSVAAGPGGIYAGGSLNGNSSPYYYGNGVTLTVDNIYGSNILLVKYR